MSASRAAVVAAALLAASVARADRSAFLTLFVNTVDHGEVMVILEDEDVLVPVTALDTFHVRHGGGRIVPVGDKSFVSLTSLAPEVRFQFDERALSLHLTVPPQRLESRSMDMHSAAPADLVYHQGASGFLNYSLRVGDFK